MLRTLGFKIIQTLAMLWAVVTIRMRPAMAGAAGVAVLLLPVALSQVAVSPSAVGDTTVAVVQGDVPATGLGFAT